jgi:nitroreductase
LLGKPPETFFQWTKQQTFIALGFLLLAAATEWVDAGPMAGFDAEAVDQLAGLTGGPYSSVAVVALGYRSPEDHVANLPKVRLPKEDTVERR